MNLNTKLHTMTVPMITRPARGVAARLVAPIALIAVVVAAIVGFSQLRASDDAPSKHPATVVHHSVKVEPLVIPEEQAFIDRAHHGPVASEAGGATQRVSTFEPLVIPEEQAFIDGEYSHGSTQNWCATHTPC